MGGDTSPEQQYSLRWNDFHSSILSSFRHLRDEEDFVDVTLACDGCSFTAHKVVLSACSPYFRRLLKANPCQHPIIILRDVQQKDMENLLRFMYNGEVNVGQENLTDFLKTAQMLQVRGLADVSAGAATQRLTTTSEEKISQPSTLPWNSDRPEALREEGLSPPPAKRARSSERDFSSQERAVSPASRNNNGDLPGSLLGQALEGGTNAIAKEKSNSESPVQAQSTGDDSSSSDTAISDHGDPVTPKTEPPDYPLLDEHNPFHTNGGLLDQTRPPSFPGALLGLQGLSGLIPGPSGMHGNTNDFDAATFGSENIHRRSPSHPSRQVQYHQCDVAVKYECPLCEQILRNIGAARNHIDQHYPRDSPICPVTDCGKRFTHPNSVRNHMRQKHSRQWELMKQIKWTL
ncbi:protein abrupt isoform X4 [Cylas formicarius]|uniref:protein abrupt isoform X4 n=1 Tax=Cylas formicarius TaxID=197179 RepID=UPI002958A002|nr:protein abrupt isoform X4 [Cylas formicarius]